MPSSNAFPKAHQRLTLAISTSIASAPSVQQHRPPYPDLARLSGEVHVDDTTRKAILTVQWPDLHLFNAMRRVKSYLRSTMADDRLSALAILHSHREMDVDINSIINEFAAKQKPSVRICLGCPQHTACAFWDRLSL